ncbi:MAG: GPR endopeptidase [Bacillota bacterium]|nr:GPR endopeptidase [Bacillota bacterium]
MNRIRTDLAIETKEILEGKEKKSINGVESFEESIGDVKVTKVNIVTNEGEKAMGKPKGSYLTIEIKEILNYDNESQMAISQIISDKLKEYINIEPFKTVLVVGLGNWNITPDALGPKVVEKLFVTRHLKELMPDSIDERMRPVCAIAPGVLGLTGMETSEVIRGIAEKIKPDMVICIDALSSRKMDRVNTTFQIGNTGISPGSGVGNRRMELSLKTLNVPVIAIGVPTVVDAATMANDTIDLVIDEMMSQSKNGTEFYSMLKSIDKNEKETLIKEVLNPYLGDLVVTPKDVDLAIETLSKVLANGINLALQPFMEQQDIDAYLN